MFVFVMDDHVQYLPEIIQSAREGPGDGAGSPQYEEFFDLMCALMEKEDGNFNNPSVLAPSKLYWELPPQDDQDAPPPPPKKRGHEAIVTVTSIEILCVNATLSIKRT